MSIETREEEKRISELKEQEARELISRYVKSSKNSLKKTTISDSPGEAKDIDTSKKMEIKSIEPRSVVLIYLILFLVLLSITIYDLISLESKKTIPFLFLVFLTFLAGTSFLLYKIIPLKNNVLFSLTNEGIWLKDRLLTWDQFQTFKYINNGYDYLIIKELEQEEIIMPLFSLRYFPNRISAFIEIYKAAGK
ncbi:hypothetical protein [uncultured Fluviicola sp.]|uniref:hypothetical protein n=1 Tax=uncultured Fluviicola sp. TaxID=463303 RepID=UPI0025D74BCE|nr:hypothetical protein [uncultured Fluviicola sp.]